MNQHSTNLVASTDSKPTDSAEITVYCSKTNPIKLAEEVAFAFFDGVMAVIHACALLVAALSRFEGDIVARETFLKILVEKNVIPRRSHRLGEFNKSKLAMLCKIGENYSLLLSDALRPFLQAGYSVLYYIVRYYEVLDGDHDSRLAQLADVFSREGHLTRDFLVAKVNEIEKAKKAGAKASQHNWNETAPSNGFDLIVATPSHSELRRLKEYPSDAVRCLRIHHHIAAKAVVVVRGRLADLPVIENKLLAGCGFDFISNIILVNKPIEPDVTTAEVIVIARHASSSIMSDLEWLEIQDIRAFASRVAPDAQNKLHLFATEETEGYVCIVGDANLELVE